MTLQEFQINYPNATTTPSENYSFVEEEEENYSFVEEEEEEEENYSTQANLTQLNSTDEWMPSLGPTELRMNEAYIRGYIMWARLFFTALIPVILLLFLNVRIVYDIISSAKKVQRYVLLRYVCMHHIILSLVFSIRFGSARRQRKEINLSMILICIVVVFFCCHTPRIILDIHELWNIEKVISCKPWNPGYVMHALLYVSRMTTILNSTLNFFIYCVVGHTFRRELFRTLGFKVFK